MCNQPNGERGNSSTEKFSVEETYTYNHWLPEFVTNQNNYTRENRSDQGWTGFAVRSHLFIGGGDEDTSTRSLSITLTDSNQAIRD